MLGFTFSGNDTTVTAYNHEQDKSSQNIIQIHDIILRDKHYSMEYPQTFLTLSLTWNTVSPTYHCYGFE